MRRAALLAIVAVTLGGLAAAGIVGARARRTLAFTLGVGGDRVAVTLRPGHTACQEPIAVDAAFDAVELVPVTGGKPGSSLSLQIVRGSTTVATGSLREGYAGDAAQVVPIGHVPAVGKVAVCIRDTGTRAVGLRGGADAASPSSQAVLDGRPAGADVHLVFRRAHAIGTLALLPDILERASLFHAGWIGPWLFWILLAAIVIAVPALLAVAVVAAAAAEETESKSPEAATRGTSSR